MDHSGGGCLYWGGCDCAGVEQGGDGNSVLYAQFYCETKTALKNKAYSKKKVLILLLVVGIL